MNHIPWIPAFVVAILPKCPFCILAYSGAITLCSGTTIYPNGNSPISYFSIGLGLFIIACLLLNYRGRRTLWAIGISLLGVGFLLSSQFYYVSAIHYLIGSLLLLFGIWYNGSFLYFYNKLKSNIQINILLTKNNKSS